MVGALKDGPCSSRAHGQAAPGGGPCPLCGRPRCSAAAKTRAGERCRKNPHPGASICTNHGLTAAGRAKAAERRTEAAAEELRSRLIWNTSAAPVSDPIGELQLLAGQMRQAVDLLGAMLGPGDPCESCGRGPLPLDSPAGVAWLKQQRELRGVLEAMGRLGIASRAVEVQQGQADLVLGWLRDALEAGRGMPAGSTPAQVVEVVLAAFVDAMRRGRGGSVIAGELDQGTAS